MSRQKNEPPKGDIIVYQPDSEGASIQVRLEGETVWLTQNLIADLYQTTQQNVSLHIRNIYEEGELTPEATHKDFLLVRPEGKRHVRRRVDHYNVGDIEGVDVPFQGTIDGFTVSPGVARGYDEDTPPGLKAARIGVGKVQSPNPPVSVNRTGPGRAISP